MEQNEPVALRDCIHLNENLQATHKDSLQSSRFEIPLALVHDRFILAIGGKTNKTMGTRRCEAYDTVTNHWFQIDALPLTYTSGTGAVVMND